MKKILLVYATAGVGHVKASLAIEDAIKYKEEISYEIVDILDYTNVLLRWIYRRLYIILVKYFPALWALIYYPLDVPWVYNYIKNLRTLINRLNTRKFADYLCKAKPNVIISTHFFPSEVVSFLKRKKIIASHLISVITDYKLHTYWISKEVDFFIVANNTLGQHLRAVGIDEKRIKMLGMPIESKFYEVCDKNILYKKLDIHKGLFTVLIASGGFGVGPIEALVNELTSVNMPLQLLIACGRNRPLYEDISQIKQRVKMPVKAYGFVDNMHELMEVSDLLISKSGGMTISEALAKELPMIVVSPIPGQEMRNCAFMVEHGAAIREDDPSRIKEKVIELFNNREILHAMRENIRAIKKPNPALHLVDFITKI